MKKLTRKNILGLTLAEVLVASTISTIVVAMIYMIYRSGSDLWETKRIQADLQAQGRLALAEIASELRQTTRTSGQTPSPNLFIPASPNNTAIDFYLPEDIDGDGLITNTTNGLIEWNTSNLIQYLYNSTEKKLRRLEQGNWTTLAHDADDVRFADITIDSQLFLNELRVNLTLSRMTPRQRNISMSFSTMIRLRN